MSALPNDDGGPAFPTPGEEFIEGPQGRGPASAWGMEGKPGMSLRDWFAGQALAGVLTHPTAFGSDFEALSGSVLNSPTRCYALAKEAASERADPNAAHRRNQGVLRKRAGPVRERIHAPIRRFDTPARARAGAGGQPNRRVSDGVVRIR